MFHGHRPLYVKNWVKRISPTLWRSLYFTRILGWKHTEHVSFPNRHQTHEPPICHMLLKQLIYKWYKNNFITGLMLWLISFKKGDVLDTQTIHYHIFNRKSALISYLVPTGMKELIFLPELRIWLMSWLPRCYLSATSTTAAKRRRQPWWAAQDCG